MNFDVILYIIGCISFLVLFSISKRVKDYILSIFGGSIELTELAGVGFFMLFAYMIIKEGNRDHEWHYYNEMYIFFTAGAAMTGLGLKGVLNTYKHVKTNKNEPKQDTIN